MKITYKTWLVFLIFVLISAAIWFRFSYPQFSFLDLSIDRKEALRIAKDYLSQEMKIDISRYQTAIVCISEDRADRYLQRTLGFRDEQKFIKEHDFDLFMWLIRFFRENEKEEIRLAVSAATGEVISYSHTIEDSEARPLYEETATKKRAIEFLKNKFNFNVDSYTLHAQLSKKRDNRTDYTLSWQKNGVYIPWSDEPDTGGAKLITSVTMAGYDVLTFSKGYLDIPEQFSRQIERQKSVGRNLSTAFGIIYVALLMGATFLVVVRKHHLMMHVTKIFFIVLAVILFSLHLVNFANKFQNILFHYTTTSTFLSYFWQYAIGLILTAIYVAISMVMPGLAGESLHYEVFPNNRARSFLHYINSTFLSRKTFLLIVLGYLVAVIMLGIQSAAFQFGRQYLGVWTERTWMTRLSTSYLPFIAAFIIGLKASCVEEITFRIFTISWGKKLFKSTLVAVIIASVIWGYGHSGYLVFPMWFRGLEVTCLGLLLSFIFLRYGIIPVVIAHYVFDVFWVASGYLLGKSQPFNFYTSLCVLLLPLFFGFVAFFINRPDKERLMRWRLSTHQIYNLQILKTFLKERDIKDRQTMQQMRQELISHGWDIAVVEKALEEYVNNA